MDHVNNCLCILELVINCTVYYIRKGHVYSTTTLHCMHNINMTIMDNLLIGVTFQSHNCYSDKKVLAYH